MSIDQAETPRQLTPEDRINELEAAATQYIEADTRFRGPGYWAEHEIIRKGVIVGGAVATVGLVDLFGTYVNEYNKNEGRESVSARMDGVLEDLSSRLEGNASQIEICTDFAGGACSETEVFDLSTGEGVQIFAQGTLQHHEDADEHQHSPLETPEAEALEDAIWSLEAPEGRTEEFDQEILGAMQTATDEYVAEVPDDPAPTTNSFTGEVTGYGLGILAASLTVSGLMRHIRRKNTQATTEAFGKMTDARKAYPHKSNLSSHMYHMIFDDKVNSTTGLQNPTVYRMSNPLDRSSHRGIIKGKRTARIWEVRQAAEKSRASLNQPVEA